MSTPLIGSAIRFGPFEFAPQSSELRKHGLRIKLQDQPLKILLALLEQPGEVVSRDELRERIWANNTLVDFDHGLSAAVNRLRDALGDSADNPRYVETVPRRGYRFIGAVEGTPNPAVPPPPARSSRGTLVWIALASVAAAAAAVGFWLVLQRPNPLPPRVVRLTTLTGEEKMPAFSPDGTQVAFSWSGSKQDNFDIYVRPLGSTATLRLTSDPAVDTAPAWSPDGRLIAFLSTRDRAGVYLVSPFGPPDRKLIDMPHSPPVPEPAANRISWSPDSRVVVIAKANSEPPQAGGGGVYLVPVQGGGEPKLILTPAAGTYFRYPTFSPGGRHLAVALCKGPDAAPQCQLLIHSLQKDFFPQTRPPRIVRSEWSYINGLAWLPDGRSLVVSGFHQPASYLWRVPISKPAEPERIEEAGEQALAPAISLRGERLAFERSTRQPDIWMWRRGGPSVPFLTSTARDTSPQFSPDGQHIVYESAHDDERTGIWTATAGGTGLVPLAKVGQHSGTPRWSWDGKWIAFDAQAANGRWDIWKVQAGGGIPSQLTDGPADSAIPSWSRDGKWVYFTSDVSGAYQIWRVSAAGGSPRQITGNGGYVGFESVDGKTLYYTRSEDGGEGLFALPSNGGKEKQIVSDPVVRRSFAVFPNGIYYMSPVRTDVHEIRFHDFARGRSRAIHQVEGPFHFGFSVSPDQNTFLFSELMIGADLMLIEHFR